MAPRLLSGAIGTESSHEGSNSLAGYRLAVVVVRMLVPLAEEPGAAAGLPRGVRHWQEDVAALMAAEVPRFSEADGPANQYWSISCA